MKRFFAMFLAMTMMGTTAYAADALQEEQKLAKPATQEISFFRQSVDLPGYIIDGYSYFRLRDMAAIIQDIAYEEYEYAFHVEYIEGEAPYIQITRWEEFTGKAENPVELSQKMAVPSTLPVYVDDEEVKDISAYVIDGYTYFKLRDIMQCVWLSVDWDAKTNSICVDFLRAAKPVIYLYPEETTDVSVKLSYRGNLAVTYPAYGDGWEVTAEPDGTLTNHADGKEYSYLFWEGEGYGEMDFSEGFVVKGADTAAFLQETLADMGLTPQEYNEFIVYWLPYMQENPYNLISFQWENYEESAKLEITPQPDNILRVFMAFCPLEEFVEIPAQSLPQLTREGFTVVEWGGTEVK